MEFQILLSVEELFEDDFKLMSAHSVWDGRAGRSENWRGQVGGRYGKDSIAVGTKLRLIVIFAVSFIIIVERVKEQSFPQFYEPVSLLLHTLNITTVCFISYPCSLPRSSSMSSSGNLLRCVKYLFLTAVNMRSSKDESIPAKSYGRPKEIYLCFNSSTVIRVWVIFRPRTSVKIAATWFDNQFWWNAQRDDGTHVIISEQLRARNNMVRVVATLIRQRANR